MTAARTPSSASPHPDLPGFPMARGCPYRTPPGYAGLRAYGPLSRVALYDGRWAWLVSGNAEGRALLPDPRLSSDARHPGFPCLTERLAGPEVPRLPLIGVDDPEHARQRRLVGSGFGIRRIAAQRPGIQRTADRLIDAMLAGAHRRAELVGAYTLPLSSDATYALLGVPVEDRARLARHVRDTMAPADAYGAGCGSGSPGGGGTPSDGGGPGGGGAGDGGRGGRGGTGDGGRGGAGASRPGAGDDPGRPGAGDDPVHPGDGPGHADGAGRSDGEDGRGHADGADHPGHTDGEGGAGGSAGPERAFAEILGYLRDLIADRERTPGAGAADGLIGDLVAHHPPRDEADRDALVMLCAVLATGGNESTSSTLATAVLALLDHPDQLDALRTDAALTAGAVDELTRLSSVTDALLRVAVADIEIAGHTIRAGDAVIISTMLMNRDPRAWDDPDALDIRRRAGRHVAFGYGIHQCVGQNLARAVLEIALATLVRRVPTLRLAVASERVRAAVTTSQLGGVSELPVAW